MDLESIISKILCFDTGTIQQATKELEDALKTPGTIVDLFKIMTGSANPSFRQFAATIMKQNLKKFRDYKKLPVESRQYILANIVGAIFKESDNAVRSGMIQVLSCVIRHENQSNETWVDQVLQHVLKECCSVEPEVLEVAIFVFSKLADYSPNLFIERFGIVKGLFQTVLLSVGENSASISSTVTVNVLTAMSALVPEMLDYDDVKGSYEAAVPHIVHVTSKFAAENHALPFTAGLDILQNMAEFTPMLLNKHFRLLMEFALAVSSNTTYDSDIRIKALNFVFVLVDEKKKILMKMKLVEPVLHVLMNIMASEPESNDADEFFVQSEKETPLACATSVIDKMATRLPPEKFIPPLLALLEPALQNNTADFRRRTAYIILGTIAEGCKEAICDEYLEPMLNILKQGLNDPVASVRNAALFGIGQFSEQLQPEIANYADDILPVLFNNMQGILQAQQLGQDIDQKCAERVFYALEAFCDSLEENLAPHMENLMRMILSLLSDNYSHRLKILAMALTESAAKAFEGSLLPWFQELIEKLRPMLMLSDGQEDDTNLRSQAIETLAAIARNIDKKFLPFASETMQQSIVWMESTDDIDIRRAVLNLFGALAKVTGDDLAPVLPKILNHVNRCMVEESEELPALENKPPNDESDDDGDVEVDLETESNVSSDSQYYGDNPYLEAKVQSLYTIQELSESCMKILLPVVEEIFQAVYKFLDHDYHPLRKTSIEALKTITIKWNRENPLDSNAKQALHILMPKLQNIVCKEAQADIVVEAEEAISDILTDLGKESLPTKESRQSLAHCIKQGLTYDYMCLFSGGNSDDEEEGVCDSELDQDVIEGAANLLAALGKAVESEEFAEYFRTLEPLIIKHMNNAKENEIQIERGHLIGILAECYAPLGHNVAPYFAKHCKIMVRACKSRQSKTRQNAVFGLGEMVRSGNESTYSGFPEILQTLSEVLATEKKRIVVDNVLGALSRLILTNATLVPLEQVIPIMLQNLPIVDDEIESFSVMECFELLYNTIPETMHSHTAAIVSIAVHTIAKTICDKTVVKRVVKLVQNIRSIYPDDYQLAIANPALMSLLPLAQEQASGQL